MILFFKSQDSPLLAYFLRSGLFRFSAPFGLGRMCDPMIRIRRPCNANIPAISSQTSTAELQHLQ